MNLVVTGHHLELTDSLKKYVSNKMDRLERHFNNVTKTSVILSVEKNRQKAEATINLSGNSLYAESVNEDMYAAIDNLTDKLDRQIVKHKEKIKNHHRGEKRIISEESLNEQ